MAKIIKSIRQIGFMISSNNFMMFLCEYDKI
nr:MAG TPA: hypothetical protein [Siphoviridae sp. ct4aE30]